MLWVSLSIHIFLLYHSKNQRHREGNYIYPQNGFRTMSATTGRIISNSLLRAIRTDLSSNAVRSSVVMRAWASDDLTACLRRSLPGITTAITNGMVSEQVTSEIKAQAGLAPANTDSIGGRSSQVELFSSPIFIGD